MKKISLLSSLSAMLLLFGSCASIVSRSDWPVTFNTSPSGAKITIINRNTVEVFKGTTPATVTLKASAGFFKKESYKVRFEMQGYDVHEIPVECRVNGWYWGNIVFGG